MVELVGLDARDEREQAGKALHAARVQLDPIQDGEQPREAVSGIFEGRSADDPMNFIALFQQPFGQVGPVLPRDARNHRSFHGSPSCVIETLAELSS